MKRKLATLLTFALSTTMLLGGCGKGSQEETSNWGTSKKTETLSEYLSKEKTIAYVVSEMDKAKTPKDIYFFEKGKLTIIPGEEFGMTLGDFSQMKDKEIWEKYKEVRESYSENYVTEKEAGIDDIIEKKLEEEKASLEKIQSMIDLLVETQNNGYNLTDNSMYALDNYFKETELEIAKNYSNEEMEEYLSNPFENTKMTQEITNAALTYYQNAYDNFPKIDVDKLRSEYIYCGPFFDIPFSFVAETDSSGNYIQREYLVFPTLEDSFSSVPTRFTDKIEFANVEGADIQIYDTTYNCFGLDGGKTFCTRDSMKLDTVDSKNVLIDLKEDDIKALFKDEVIARYGDSYEELLEVPSTED